MKPSMLIVDDVSIIRHSLTEFFSRDYTVYQASNGRDAIKMLGENKDIELVLSDVKMPEMDGMELLEKIRSENSDLIVILMTAYCADELEADAKKRGAYCCLSKPFDLNELGITIKNALLEKKVH